MSGLTVIRVCLDDRGGRTSLRHLPARWLRRRSARKAWVSMLPRRAIGPPPLSVLCGMGLGEHGTCSPYSSNSVTNEFGVYGNPYSNQSATNPYATDAPRLYDQQGNYRGKLSTNQYDPASVSNPYGRYGNSYSPTRSTIRMGRGIHTAPTVRPVCLAQVAISGYQICIFGLCK